MLIWNRNCGSMGGNIRDMYLMPLWAGTRYTERLFLRRSSLALALHVGTQKMHLSMCVELAPAGRSLDCDFTV